MAGSKPRLTTSKLPTFGLKVYESLTIYGPPATKKTGNMVVGVKSGKPRVLPRKTYREWVRKAEVEIAHPWHPNIEVDVHVRALFYRKRRAGDLIGYMQALADFLELCLTCRKWKCSCWSGNKSLLVNDRQIVCWDGSRMLHDKDNPRVEVTIWKFES